MDIPGERDLVKRLRQGVLNDLGMSTSIAMACAADEIERLREVIWQLLDDMGEGLSVSQAAKDQARKALK